MNDLYKEIMVQPKTPVMNKIAKVVIIVLTVVCLLGGMMTLFFPMVIVGAGGIAACIFLLPKLEVEYEYLYVNGDLDIDAIYSKQKRKRIAEFPIEELEVIAPENSHALDSYKNKKEIKLKDFTSGDPHKNAYIMVVNKEKGQEMAKVELDESILNDMRRYAPRKVNLF